MTKTPLKLALGLLVVAAAITPVLIQSQASAERIWSEDMGVANWEKATTMCKERNMKLPTTAEYASLGQNAPSDWTPGNYWTRSTKMFDNTFAERVIIYEDTNRLVVNGDQLPKVYKNHFRCVKEDFSKPVTTPAATAAPEADPQPAAEQPEPAPQQ